MGQSMGYAMCPKPVDLDNPPTFDPFYGFPNGRKERVMIATEEEMISAKVPLHRRDYCAHLLIEYQKCSTDMWPLPYRCHHQKHAYEKCVYDDQILRMMEYEREKRLLIRKQRKEKREQEFS